MTTITLPLSYSDWHELGVKRERASIATPLSLVESEVFEYLESVGPSALTSILRDIPEPATLIVMSIGAMIREGLAIAQRSEDGILVTLA